MGDGGSQRWSEAAIAVVGLAATIATFFTIGRRPALLALALACAVSLVLFWKSWSTTLRAGAAAAAAIFAIAAAVWPRSDTAPPAPRPITQVFSGGEVVRGNGAERTRGMGYFGNRTFVARSAIVSPTDLGIELYIFSKPSDCASAQSLEYMHGALYVDAILNNDPSGASEIAMHEPLTQLFVGFVNDTKSSINSQIAPVSRIVVTRIDTRRAGVWHGQINFRDTINNPASKFSGTFAATWCGA
jgi:hypothetical protein